MFHKILKPMLLKEAEKPFLDKNYLYELKYDGIRGLVYASKDVFRVITRNGRDVTKTYPELVMIRELVGNRKVIFDGEIVAFKNGLPSFLELQKRCNLKSVLNIKKSIIDIPVCFIAFDIIYLDKSLVDLPLVERKEYLNKFLDKDVFIKTKVYGDGVKLFERVKSIGMEGIVAKRKDSKYYPGVRVDVWVKIKNFKCEEFYILGYKKLKNKYALLLGEKVGRKIVEVGRVSVTEDKEIIRKLKKLDVKYEDDFKYVKAIYKIKVHYMERTSNNTLRQPFIK